MLTYWYWPRLVDGMVQHGRVAAGWLGIGRQIPHAGAGWRWKLRPGRLQSHLQPAALGRRAHLPPCTPLPGSNTANNRGEAWLLLPQLWAGGGDYCSIWKKK